MFRKSALAMAMLGALATGEVVALGLGDIELKSALNQPLNAEVELLSASNAEMEELKVGIGSAQAFYKAGIDRPLFLTKLMFDVTRNAEGKPVVRITSRDSIREPFLDFLLELSWSKGRLLREFTLLVDPPVTMPAAAVSAQAPAAHPPRLQAAPIQSPSRRHTAVMPPVTVAPGEYGPTKRNDTLWAIAQQVRPDAGVTMEQTMLGLLRTNPEAFENSNINNLKAGYIIRVPSREEMTSISRTDALQEVRAQHAAWREAAPVSSTGAEVSGVQSESRLQLVAPESAEGGMATGSAEGGEALADVQHELMMANEELEEQRRKNEEMSGRVAVLEEQIRNMQRLIQLKDDELASLQAQVGMDTAQEPVETVAQAGEETIEPMVEEMPADQPGMEGGMDMEAAALPDAAESQVSEAVVAGDESEPMGEADMDASAETPAEQAEPAVEPEPEIEPEPVPAPTLEVAPSVPETATTPGFIDQLLGNPIWLGAGGVVLALLAFLGLRRKRGVETEFQESILHPARNKSSAESDSEIVRSEPESKDESAPAQSSLLSEFAVSDMGAIKNDGEADPLAEADVYLAYGRYQQAEDLIKEALKNEAEREELHLKLLEVYLAAKNQPDFDEHAQTIFARLENNEDPMWEKVAEMGRELSPDNPIYQPRGAVSVEDATDELEPLDEILDEELDFDTGLESADSEFEVPAKEMPEEEKGLDFDIDLSFEGSAAADENKADAIAEEPEAPEIAASFEPVEPVLDIDVDNVEPDSVAQNQGLEFDLEGFDFGAEAATEEEAGGDGELADLDEVSTKLDLARAYIDMGDPDGAKSILDEVMEEGSDSQKDEAKVILEKIA